MSSSTYTARCVLKTKKSKSAPPTKNTQPFTKQLIAGVMLPVHCSSLRLFYFVHACGVRVVFVRQWKLLAFASRQFAPKTMDLSAPFIQSRFAQFFLVSVRSGRRKPPEDRSAFHVYMRV